MPFLARPPLSPLCACAIVLLNAGCDPATTTADAAALDAATGADVGQYDAATLDMGALDTGGTDASTPDSSLARDASGSVDANVPSSASCAAISASIVAATGNTITVSAAGNGQVNVGGQTKSLRQVVSQASSSDTILLEDGTYTFAESDGSSYTGLYFTTANIVLRSASGNRDAVILDSNYADHGGESAVITVAAPGVVIADLTVKRSIFHLIHFWADGDSAQVHNVRLIDGGQQFMKASPGGGATVDDVQITCNSFEMTPAGRDNVWGYGSQTGNTTCYTGGIDTHDARNWLVADNRFEGIYCDASGTQRPAHGKKGDVRNNLTYQGGLAEYAIHHWDSAQGSAHIVERNVIIDCARGIGIGMAGEVYGTIVRNNMIFSRHAGSAEHDVGIHISRGHDIDVLNNTVFFSSAQAYANAIEYRFDVSSGLRLINNLTNQQIRSRNSAQAMLGNNVSDAQASWFADLSNGDLHLADCNIAALDGAGASLAEVIDDIDGQARGANNDIGADQCFS